MMRLDQHFTRKDRKHNLAPSQLQVMFTPNDGHQLWDDRAIREVQNDAEEVKEVEPVGDDDDDDVEVVGVFGPTKAVKVQAVAVDVEDDNDDDVKVVGV